MTDKKITHPLAPYSRTTFLSILVLFCLLVAARAPQILLKGRIWAEDGKFLQLAFHNTFPAMLTYVVPGMGYRIFFQNIVACAAARLVPLEYAPYVFIISGLALQALPLLLLMLARAELQISPILFGLVALCFLLTTPNYDLWLTTVTAGFLLGAAAAIILISPATSTSRKWLARVVLATAVSTGTPTLFLIPFYVYRCWREKQRERLIQTSILLVFGAFQVWIMLHGQGGRKFVFSTDGILAALLTNQVLLPLFGYNLVANVGDITETLRKQVTANTLSGNNYCLLIGSVTLFASSLYWLVKRATRIETRYLVGAAMLTSVFSIVGSLSGLGVISLGADSRYFYVPNLLINLALVLTVTSGHRLPRVARYAVTAVTVWVLGVGAVGYFRFPEYFFSGPAWRDEVAAWRRSPMRPLQVSPTVIGLKVQPLEGISSTFEAVPPGVTSDRFTSAVGISGGVRFAQRFHAHKEGLYQIEIEMVTWGRPPSARDYTIEWELYEFLPGAQAFRCRGVIQGRSVADWTPARIDVCEIPSSRDKSYELRFKSLTDVPTDGAVGFPLYRLTTEDAGLAAATVGETPVNGRLSAKLKLYYTSMTSSSTAN